MALPASAGGKKYRHHKGGHYSHGYSYHYPHYSYGTGYYYRPYQRHYYGYRVYTVPSYSYRYYSAPAYSYSYGYPGYYYCP